MTDSPRGATGSGGIEFVEFSALMSKLEAGLDEGILPLWLPSLFCMWNPYINNKYQ
jgi:hypothetical protein